MSADDVAAWSDPVPSLAELGAVHFVGIGGAGMSGIARILLARGVRVSGSDRRDTPTLLALRALGARVEVVESMGGMTEAVATARGLAESDDVWMPDQFANPANPAAHRKTTGPELLEQLDRKIDVLVAGIGTGGTAPMPA